MIVGAYEALLHHNRMIDDAALSEFSRQTMGNLMQLRALCLQGQTNQQQEIRDFAAELGTALMRLDLLRNLHRYLQRQLFLLPQSALTNYALTENDFFRSTDPTKLTALFKGEADIIRHHYHNALALLPKTARKIQRSNLIFGKIKMATLDTISKEGFLLLQQYTRLTPLHKLWLTWCS
jgi:phytoene synthase